MQRTYLQREVDNTRQSSQKTDQHIVRQIFMYQSLASHKIYRTANGCIHLTVSVSEPIAGCARADMHDLFVNEYLVKIQFIYVVESITYYH